eukprot:gene1894-biopygen6905
MDAIKNFIKYLIKVVRDAEGAVEVRLLPAELAERERHGGVEEPRRGPEVAQQVAKVPRAATFEDDDLREDSNLDKIHMKLRWNLRNVFPGVLGCFHFWGCSVSFAYRCVSERHRSVSCHYLVSTLSPSGYMLGGSGDELAVFCAHCGSKGQYQNAIRLSLARFWRVFRI